MSLAWIIFYLFTIQNVPIKIKMKKELLKEKMFIYNTKCSY